MCWVEGLQQSPAFTASGQHLNAMLVLQARAEVDYNRCRSGQRMHIKAGLKRPPPMPDATL
jgi:hypothetical protein